MMINNLIVLSDWSNMSFVEDKVFIRPCNACSKSYDSQSDSR